VAVGISLGTTEALVEKDPARATEPAVAKHTPHIFGKRRLPPSDDDNRRVPAVPAYLDRG
jgi:hypothetical protein